MEIETTCISYAKIKVTDFPDRILFGFSAQTYFQDLQGRVFMILDEHFSQNYDYTVKDQYMGIDLIRNCADVPYVVS